MTPITLAKLIKRYLVSLLRLIAPKPLPSLEFSSSQWNNEYSTPKWDYLGSLPELGRYAIIAGYVSYLNPRASVLEVGCGTGLLLKHLAHMPLAHYKGVDISEKAIEDARKTYGSNFEFEACDGAAYSDNKKYDIIVFNETLYYFNDCIKILKHYQRNLNACGQYIVSMVVGDVSCSHWKQIEQHFHIVDAVSIKNSQDVAWTCKLIRVKEAELQMAQ